MHGCRKLFLLILKMIKKYFAVYYIQKMQALGAAACDTCSFLESNIPQEENKAVREPIGQLLKLLLFEVYYPMIKRFPELRDVELLDCGMEEKVIYNIKCQKTAKTREKVVRRRILAKEANAELARYKEEHADYKGLIWLELDEESTKAMIEYRAMKENERMERIRKTDI